MLLPRNRKLLAVYTSLASIWVLLFQVCRLYTYSDPSSFFYDRHRAYETKYTDIREKQADDFLALANHEPIEELSNISLINNDAVTRSSEEKRFCIGIPSVRRENEQFLPKALASLVQGLRIEERQTIYITVLLADDDPTNNPAFGQTWLNRLADEVLFYGNGSLPGSPENYNAVMGKHPNSAQELTRNDRVHRDYATLMASCQARDAEYFVLIEDDIIAAQHWLQRLSNGLDILERTENPHNWLYLRLFYSETYLGWNSEEWPTYLAHAVYLFSVVLFLYFLFTALDSARRSHTLHLKSIAWNIPHLTFWTASFVALYFLAGRLTVDPYPEGVHEMANYGCCAQGLVISHQHLNTLGSALGTAPEGVAGDSFIEGYADKHGLKKYAITPSVLQHIGIRGSSDSGSTKKLTWNFSFEKIEDEALR
ncbi:region-domain-containing protein [Fusarium avenaceum]|nr:region-domain-containing protein [Fusarium avenaceum]